MASSTSSGSSGSGKARSPQQQQQQQQTPAKPVYRRTQTHSSAESTLASDGQQQQPGAPGEGAASVSLRSLQQPSGEQGGESGPIDLREVAIRRFHLDRLNPPALNRLKMAHELVIRSCGMSVCATLYCSDKRILVANETTSSGKHSIAEVKDELLRALLVHLDESSRDVVLVPDLHAFALQHNCTPCKFKSFFACAVRIPPFTASNAILVGMFAAFDVQLRSSLGDDDGAFIRHLADAASFVIEDHFAAVRRRGELLAQKAIVDLNRQVAGESASRPNSTPPSGRSDTNAGRQGASLFTNAAQALCDALDADAALILDVSSFRLRAGGQNTDKGRTQTASTPGASYPATVIDGLSGGSSSGGSSGAVGTISTDGSIATPELPHEYPPTPPMSKRELSEVSQSAASSSSNSNALDDLAIAAVAAADREPSRAVLDAETSCFFGLSREPLHVLGAAGDTAALGHFETLSGQVSRPCIARFLASRHLTRSYAETKAEGEFEAGRAKLLRRPDSLVPLLPSLCKGLLAAPVLEMNGQPAFVVLTMFKDPPYRWEEPDYLLIEQIGAVLLSSVHRSRARAVDRAQTQFMQKVSHELRTPLHAILGVTEMTRMALPPQNDELLSLVDSINLAADSLSTTIDDLVDFNALNGSMLHTAGVKPANVAMHASIFDIFGAISDAAVAQYLYRRRVLRQADLTTPRRPVESEGLPPPEMFISLAPLSTADVVGKVELDIESLRRIVSKVISNALRATETGIITVSAAISQISVADDGEISVNDKKGGGGSGGIAAAAKLPRVQELEIIISDTGKGMTDDFIRARLFQPFSQADPFSSGTGLSLTLCRNMIDELGGRVRVTSTLEKGTRFFIHVPLHGAGFELTERAQQRHRAAAAVAAASEGGLAHAAAELKRRNTAGGRGGRRRGGGKLSALFLGFEDEGHSGLKSYRAQMAWQFDLRIVEWAGAGDASGGQKDGQDDQAAHAVHASPPPPELAHVVFILSEAADDGRANRALEELLEAARGREHERERPLVVILQAFGFDQAQQAYATSLSSGAGTTPGQNKTGANGSGNGNGNGNGNGEEGEEEARSSSDYMGARGHDEGGAQPSGITLGYNVVARAKAAGCQVVTLQRPLGLKSLLILDDLIRNAGREPAAVAGKRALSASQANSEGVHSGGVLVAMDAVSPGAVLVTDVGQRTTSVPAGGMPATFHVLVVEDNPLNARILTTMLKKLGVDFHEAVNGREAVDMYREHRHNVVLMDISMPEMDGFEACEKMKAMEGSDHSHIIAITALSSESDRIRGREVGFADWIVKPVRLGPLAADVKRWKDGATTEIY